MFGDTLGKGDRAVIFSRVFSATKVVPLFQNQIAPSFKEIPADIKSI